MFFVVPSVIGLFLYNRGELAWHLESETLSPVLHPIFMPQLTAAWLWPLSLHRTHKDHPVDYLLSASSCLIPLFSSNLLLQRPHTPGIILSLLAVPATWTLWKGVLLPLTEALLAPGSLWLEVERGQLSGECWPMEILVSIWAPFWSQTSQAASASQSSS